MAKASNFLTCLPNLKETIWWQRIENEALMKHSREIEDELINEIIQMRTEFEARIDDDPTNLEYIMDYINYEEHFYTKISKNKNATINQEEIKDSFVERIGLVLEYGIEMSCARQDFLSRFVSFHKLVGCNFTLQNIFNDLLERYSHKPQVWINIGRFYVCNMDGYKDGRTDGLMTFISGLKKHPTSEELYKEINNVHREWYSKSNNGNIDFEEFARIHGKTNLKTMWPLQTGASEEDSLPPLSPSQTTTLWTDPHYL